MKIYKSFPDFRCKFNKKNGVSVRHIEKNIIFAQILRPQVVIRNL